MECRWSRESSVAVAGWIPINWCPWFLHGKMGSCCCFDFITERLPALAYWPWKFVYWSSGLITFNFTSLGLSGHTHLLARCSMFASLDLILYEEGFKMSSPGTIILQKRLVTTDDHLSTWKKYNVRLVKVLASTRLLWKSFKFIILGNFSEATHQLYLVATWIKQIHISPTEGTWGCGGHLLISKVCGCVAIELHCGALQLQPLGTFAGVEFSLQNVGTDWRRMKTTGVSWAAIDGNWDCDGDKFHNVGVLWDLVRGEVIVYRKYSGILKLHL